jgi:hypothetical protein
MPHLITDFARAYVYHGDWVADCPREHCGNVEFLMTPVTKNGPRVIPVPVYTCSYCGLVVPIDWPRKMVEILAVLTERPIPHTRNWYPADHATAVKFRVEHGQTVDELRDENREHGV